MSQNRAKKPEWVIEKERHKKQSGDQEIWLFGLHAVRDALDNPRREKLRLVVTQNAHNKLEAEIAKSGITPEIVEPRKFNVPIDNNSVHQGAALSVKPLNWGNLSEQCAPRGEAPLLLVLDRVTDPHNVGAMLRSAEVFGARAVIAPARHSAPETGALAKTASGALERQPYLKIQNLNRAIGQLQEMGYLVIGMDGEADASLETIADDYRGLPIAVVMGAEGPGLRQSTKEACDRLVKIDYAADFGSLNVSNAAAVALYALRVKKVP